VFIDTALSVLNSNNVSVAAVARGFEECPDDKGRTIASVSTSIASSYSCVVEIGNFLDADLIQLQHVWPSGSAPDTPPVIKAGTRE
ncbi:unnamed protein product, partial [Allacma fusca]